MNALITDRACCSDLAPIAEAFGDEAFFRERLERQDKGDGILLIARFGDAVVGTVYLWLEPAEDPSP